MSADTIFTNIVSVLTLLYTLMTTCLQTCSDEVKLNNSTCSRNVYSKTRDIKVNILIYKGLQNITAHLGQNITLPCQASSHKPFIAVEWTRPDLTPDNVFFYMDEYTYPKQQHPYFLNRVDLLDRQMKDGNLSLILRNVNSNDSGTYECRVKEKNGRRRIVRRLIESPPINSIRLTVIESGPTAEDTGNERNKDGHVGLTVGLSAGAVLLVAAVASVIFKKRAKQQNSYKQGVYQPVNTDDEGDNDERKTNGENVGLSVAGVSPACSHCTMESGSCRHCCLELSDLGGDSHGKLVSGEQ